jgi:hypothetical protein
MSIVAGLTLVGCYQPGVDRDELRDGLEPPTGLFDDGAVIPPPTDGRVIDAPMSQIDAGTGCPVDSPLSALHIIVRTTAVGGRYQPRNVGAIWIETAAGQYVKTVKRWANRRKTYLTSYMAVTGGDVTDAVSGATLSSHITHDVTWNLTGRDHCEIVPGNYRIAIELTDGNMTGASLRIPFTKGTTASMSTPADTANFHNMVIDLH